MKASDPNTRIGKKIAVILTPDVSVIFAGVTSDGLTTVKKFKSGAPCTPAVQPPSGPIQQYYEIRTTASYCHDPDAIEIRIIYDAPVMTQPKRVPQLWQLNGTQWINITKDYIKKHHLLVGITNHLSIFGAN